MATKKGELQGILKELKKIGDVEGSAVVTRDGLLVISDLPKDVDSETFAAMSATMFGAAETAMTELKEGEVDRVISEGHDGKLIAMGAGPLASVVVSVSADANLGLVLVELRQISERIKAIMGNN
jgi:predicted regulator of Ras-like GTPase activity (Roadblock/LC7/MglB family)